MVKRYITNIVSCLISKHLGLILKCTFACIFNMPRASARVFCCSHSDVYFHVHVVTIDST